MKTFEVTFCYGERRGKAHGEIVRATSATRAISRASENIRKGISSGMIKGRIEEIDATLSEVLVRQLGFD